MDVGSTELSRFNDAPPPSDFDTEGAWEIKEIVPVNPKAMANTIKTPPESTTPRQYKKEAGTPRYLVEKNPNLGVGGMAHVYRGWDRRLSKYVAIKELDYSLEGFDDFQHYYKSIELEAKSMARINHPGIPVIYGFSFVDKSKTKHIPVIIMELIKGKTLRSRLEREDDPIPVKEVATIISQTASTLDYINNAGLSHGDVKPGNIMLSENYIKLLDFGVSNWADPQGPHAMTLGYSAPEAKTTMAGDIFSLAATATAMVYNRIPEFNIENFLHVLSQSPIPNYDLGKNDRNKLIAILAKAMAEKPEERYSTATEFANDFNKVFENAEVR